MFKKKSPTRILDPDEIMKEGDIVVHLFSKGQITEMIVKNWAGSRVNELDVWRSSYTNGASTWVLRRIKKG